MKSKITHVAMLAVEAVFMTAQECKNAGYDIKTSENGDDAGYLVKNPEGSKNTPDYDGHVSWLPEETFNKLYTLVDCVTPSTR